MRLLRRPANTASAARSAGLSGVQLSFGIFLPGIHFEPCQKAANTSGCQCNRGIAGAVVQIDCVSIRADRLPAREDDILHISVALIVGLRPEDPGVSAL
jgi:hypothetical protein